MCYCKSKSHNFFSYYWYFIAVDGASESVDAFTINVKGDQQKQSTTKSTNNKQQVLSAWEPVGLNIYDIW